MTSLLIFVGFLAAMVAGGWIVSNRTGSHAWFLESWTYNPDEPTLWRDPRADVVIVPKLGRAAFMRPIRAHRWSVVATDQRVILANKTFSGKQMVRYVLWRGRSPDANSQRLDGGLLTIGYSAMAIEPHAETSQDYVTLIPVATEPSSANIAEIRIYSELAASFRPR